MDSGAGVRVIAFWTTFLMVVACASSQGYTGTFGDGASTILVLDQAADGGIVGRLHVGGETYGVEGRGRADGSMQGLIRGGQRFFSFDARLSPDGATLQIETLQVDMNGRPIGTPPVRTNLRRTSNVGQPPASLVPARGGGVPNVPMAVPLPAPGTIVPGVRLIFYLGSSSTAGSRNSMTAAPCDPKIDADCYTDPQTGQTYRRADVPSLGSIGYAHLDILYFDGRTCVGRLQNYGLDPISGLSSYLGANVVLSEDGTCGDWWKPPARLAEIAAANAGSITVRVGPYEIAGMRFEAVSIGATSIGGGHETYDAASGVLVVASSISEGRPILTLGPNNVLWGGAGATNRTYAQFLALRPTIGFTGEPLPPHVRAATNLSYVCSTSTSMSGLPTVTFPCRQSLTITRRSEFWAVLEGVQFDGTEGPGSVLAPRNQDVVTSGGPGGVFASPTVLRGLTVGQTLDTDPFMNVTTTVTHRDDRVVGVLEQGPLHRKQLTYDLATGWLVQAVVERQLGPSTMTVYSELVGIE